MPYHKFDRNMLQLKDLGEREHGLDLSIMMDPREMPVPFENPKLYELVEKIKEANRRNASVILMMGAHVIRSGCTPWLIRLMEEGVVTHFALNGAGAIHDFEFALIGKTTESVARYIQEGQFGLWKQSGLINDHVNRGAMEGLGFGESLGKAISEQMLPFRKFSLLAAGYEKKVPVTVHVGIGMDIIHEHPNFDGALTGKASYDDFLVFTKAVEKLQGGVFINAGSAVTGPEVYLKALAMARNVAHGQGRAINAFTTGVFDILDIDGDTATPPDRSDPRYYFRPWKTILSRTVSDGGTGYYIRGEHKRTISSLAYALLEEKGDRR
ncbi:MAG: hypothetical protein R6W96_07145 [Clostridia bacterium]